MNLTDPKTFEARLVELKALNDDPFGESDHYDYLDELQEAIRTLHATIAEREKRVVELEVALEPFKRWADQLDSSPNLVPDGCPLVTSPRDVSDFNVSHLRAARTALAHQPTYLADKIAEAKREGAAEIAWLRTMLDRGVSVRFFTQFPDGETRIYSIAFSVGPPVYGGTLGQALQMAMIDEAEAARRAGGSDEA